ncbi:MAG: CHAT domain-containing protein [Thermomicrobiales bacterium]
MAQIPDLEIGLERSGPETFAVSLRFTSPDSDVDAKLTKDGLRLNLEELRQYALDAGAYGRCLGQSLFAVPGVRESFAVADAADGPLRVRLDIDRNAQELDAVRWESLADPDAAPAAPLFMAERIRFSRIVDSPDWRRVVRRARLDTRALVVVANPGDLESWNLAPIDVAAEVERAKAGLAGIEVTVLGGEERATLSNIGDRLLCGPDIVYLVCHGALINGVPKLYLENEAGATDPVDGDQLVSALKGLEPPPRLIVLVSCQSAGTGEGDALGALGPRLGEAGIAAVLAMHGNVQMATIDAFMPIFFRELQRDGEIDRAVAVARGEVQQRADAWAPVLYMRLKSGKLWYDRGFTVNGRGRSYDKWQGLVNSMLAGECTAVLGRGLADSLVGSRRENALRLARAYHYPMAAHEQEDLPQVAQFVMQDQGRQNLMIELRESFRKELLKRLGDDVPPALVKASANTTDPLVLELGKRRWQSDPEEPHWVLASLPLKLYVTTTFNGLMAEALRAAGKNPREELFRWNDFTDWGPSIYDAEPDYEPTPEEPLVYYLAGRVGKPDSMVVTEDDYFDFLIGVTRKLSEVGAIPGVVKTAFVNSTLLFLGFEMDGWDFRALFRALMDQGGKSRRRDYVHAGVQINPEEGRILEIERAREYLEGYFNNEDIHIYWGGVEDFVRDLRRQPGFQP